MKLIQETFENLRMDIAFRVDAMPLRDLETMAQDAVDFSVYLLLNAQDSQRPAQFLRDIFANVQGNAARAIIGQCVIDRRGGFGPETATDVLNLHIELLQYEIFKASQLYFSNELDTQLSVAPKHR